MSARLHSCSSEMKLRCTCIEKQRAVSDEFVTIIHEVTLHSTLAPSASFTLLRKTQPRSTTAAGPHLTTTMTSGSYVVNRSKPRIRVGPDLHALPQLSPHVRIKVNFVEGRPLSIGYVNVLRLAVVPPKRFIVFFTAPRRAGLF
jgi:hypothetical protein